MSLGFAAAVAKLGPPIAEYLLKRYISEGVAASGKGLLDIAASRITDEESQRVAVRQFEDIGDKVVRRLLPLFENVENLSAEAVAYEVGLTLAAHLSVEFFLERDLDPAKLGIALRAARPLARSMFSQEEISLYERSLDEAIRYMVGVAQNLPRFEVQAAATALGRLSRIGGDLEKVLDGIARIERLVQQTDAGETTRRYEADYRQAVQRNLDYLELFGADISPEAQRHSLSVGYVSLNLTSSTARGAPATHSADSLMLLLAVGDGRLLLRGDAGSGKSTLLRWLAIETASGRQLQRSAVFNWLVHAPVRAITAGAGGGKSTLLRSSAIETASGRQLQPPSVRNWLAHAPGRTITTKEFNNLMRSLIIDYDPNFTLDVPVGEGSQALVPQIFQNGRIPFLIRLRDCSNGTLPAPEDLPPLIANELGRPPVDWVKSVLDEGNGLLLLDGVDEVPDQRRETVRRGLEALTGRYPKNQFVVTTRPAAVPEGWLAAGGFVEASINPMSPPDRAEFIRRWHAAVSDELVRQGRPENLSALADELMAKLTESPAIARLATNPLLCAALCALHRDRHRKLPESQSELCEALCQLLLHRRETQAGLHLSEFPREYSDLTYEQKRAIVQAIAHYMVRNEDSVISDTDALAETREALARFPSGRQGDAPVVLRALIERSGVLREQRPHAIDFVHNTIKEFLAAEVFVEHRDVATLARRALDDAWKQVVLFASATRDRKFATRLVEKIMQLANEMEDADRTRRMQLAAVSCRYAALHMDPEMVQALAVIEESLVPPRSMNDAEALVGSGDNVVPLLRYKRMNAREAAASVRTLRLIGTDAAQRVLLGYVNDQRLAVATELAQAINPLRLAAVRAQIVRGKRLSIAISRQITDLAPLSEISGVETLSLHGARITDCDRLSGLTNLRWLDLSSSHVESLVGLSPLSELEELDISFTPVKFLEPIKSLSKLTRLNLIGVQVSDFGPVGYLRNLRILNLATTNFADLGLLSLCSKLEHLNLISTRVSELNTLDRLYNLETLSLLGLEINDIDIVLNLPKLRELHVSDLNDSDRDKLAKVRNIVVRDYTKVGAFHVARRTITGPIG
jgi:hypothetical protein